MSAYGKIQSLSNRPKEPLRTLASPFPAKPGYTVLITHVTIQSAPSDLVGLLYQEFEQELEVGKTYPQETMDRAAFEAYFFAADVFVGIAVPDQEAVALTRENDIEKIRAERSWNEAVVGSYYVKPNYPGRSSHICNAGFVVRPPFRRLGVGKILGESYVRNALQLGYKASVFNLVYANNAGSLAIWDRLGFTRVGLIPKAGRLKTDNGEEYFDAVVVYKSFEE